MSPRPRSASNSDILEGAARAVSRLGAARLTLADVAAEVGLAPATLLQRFGSKRALLLALADHGVAALDDRLEMLLASNVSSLAALLNAASDIIPDVDTPEALSNQLSFLQFEAGDPDFHQIAVARAQRSTAGYHALLDDAVATGELIPCDTNRLARAIHALAVGSLINWAVHREGSAREWVAADISLILDSHRIRPARSGPADDVSLVPSAGRRPDPRGVAAPDGAAPIAGAPVAVAPRSNGPRARHSGHASATAAFRQSSNGPRQRPTGPPLSSNPMDSPAAPDPRGDA